MMEVFSLRARAAIEISIEDFGTDTDKTIYSEWARNNPQVRRESSNDDKGSMSPILRETILQCIHRRYIFLYLQSRSPSITQTDMMEIAAYMNHLHTIAIWLNPVLLYWPAFSGIY